MSSCFRLHSRYNPQKEADNFANTVKGSPLFIVITEPGESYVVSSLRKRFPKTKVFAIRYTNHLFLETDILFDAVWRGSPQGIPFFLINHIPDEYFSRCAFLSWLPSENVWKDEAKVVWKEIKRTSEIFLSVINTRSFFGLTWLKNIFRNLIFSKRVNKVSLQKLSSPSFFLTSGISLEEFIKDTYIKDVLDASFTLSASSSLSSLSYHGLKPSFTITTDGGFWAEPHLKQLEDSLLLFPLEARIPYRVLDNAALAFISYGSQVERYFFDQLKIPYLNAKRNGTVAGTAIDFLLEHTTANIYISGLDLSFSHSFTHARPNENVKTNLTYENRMNPASSILAKAQFSNLSLSAYASWFSAMNEDKKSRLRRVGSAGVEIPGIKRVDKKEVASIQSRMQTRNVVSVKEVRVGSERQKVVLSLFDRLEDAVNKKEFFSSLVEMDEQSIEKEMCQLVSFPDYVAFIKNSDEVGDNNENTERIKHAMQEKVLGFIEKERKKVKE